MARRVASCASILKDVVEGVEVLLSMVFVSMEADADEDNEKTTGDGRELYRSSTVSRIPQLFTR